MISPRNEMAAVTDYPGKCFGNMTTNRTMKEEKGERRQEELVELLAPVLTS